MFFILTAKQNQGNQLFGGDFLGKEMNFATELHANLRYFAAEKKIISCGK